MEQVEGTDARDLQQGLTKRCTGAELRRVFASLINPYSRPGDRGRYRPTVLPILFQEVRIIRVVKRKGAADNRWESTLTFHVLQKNG